MCQQHFFFHHYEESEEIVKKKEKRKRCLRAPIVQILDDVLRILQLKKPLHFQKPLCCHGAGGRLQ